MKKRSKKKNIQKYFKDIDILRVISCIIIFLYHLNIIKGGYLAVCAFFVLSGYLSCISAFKKDKLSLKEYYKGKLLHLYIPLIVFVGFSISIISLIPSVNWLYLKPETSSVILGYNNYWQLNSNIDYFTRHINSSFTHLWFMAILLQFDLVFPFIFKILKKIGNNNKLIPIITTFIVSIASFIYFIFIYENKGIMVAYYDTFARCYALIFGMMLGFIHTYYKNLVLNVPKVFNKIIYYIYILILIIMYIFIDASSKLFMLGMILTTLITLRLIDYGTIDYVDKNKLNKKDKIIKSISNISYEIYLYQYLFIFLFDLTKLNNILKIILIIMTTLLVSYLTHNVLNYKKKDVGLINKLLFLLIIAYAINGLLIYVNAVDHTPEMKQLEEQLNQNDAIMIQKQEEYLANLEKENNAWENTLESLKNDEEALKDYVTNLNVTGIGDSVMLGAVRNLYDRFPHSYFDAKVSRTDYEAPRILRNLRDKNMLGDIIIINLGANGLCPEYCKIEMMNIIGDRKTFWLNVTNDREVHVNAKLDAFASKYDNLYIIDWNSISNGHKEYFVSDGIHLTSTGRVAFTDAIYNYIYNIYLNEFNAKKEKIINEHNEVLLKKISFYGNDLLLTNFDMIHNSYSDAKFNIKNYTYESLKQDIINDIDNNTINKNVVIALDNTINISNEQYLELASLLENNNIYIVKMTNKDIKIDGATIIDLYSEVNKNSDYIMVDKIHLTNKGGQLLVDLLNKRIK